MKKHILFLLITAWLINPIAAQQEFRWEARLEHPDTSGFFNIFLTAAITSKLNHNFSDIRIFDDKEREIPYLKRMDKTIRQSDKAFEYKIVENKHNKWKGYTRLVVHNPEKQNITNFSLLVQNTDIEKWIQLSGSNDMENWYIIKDDFPVHTPYTDSDTLELRILDFPISNYEYYELILYDYNNEPLKVIKAQYYDISTKDVKYIKVPDPKITQNDTLEKSKSIITIEFDETQYVDKLEFNIKGPTYYLRKAELRQKETESEKKMKLEYYDQMHKSFFLRSSKKNVIYLSTYRIKSLILTIDNKDDIPLEIKSVEAYQLQNYLTASLNEEQRYVLRFGNSVIEAPIYDLRYFVDSIPDTIPSLPVRKIIALKSAESEEQKPLHIPPAVLWVVVGLVTLLLAYISYRMFGEIMGRKDDQNEMDEKQ